MEGESHVLPGMSSTSHELALLQSIKAEIVAGKNPLFKPVPNPAHLANLYTGDLSPQLNAQLTVDSPPPPTIPTTPPAITTTTTTTAPPAPPPPPPPPPSPRRPHFNRRPPQPRHSHQPPTSGGYPPRHFSPPSQADLARDKERERERVSYRDRPRPTMPPPPPPPPPPPSDDHYDDRRYAPRDWYTREYRDRDRRLYDPQPPLRDRDWSSIDFRASWDRDRDYRDKDRYPPPDPAPATWDRDYRGPSLFFHPVRSHFFFRR